MNEIIKKILENLIGLKLTRTTRAANMECLKFGELLTENRNGDLLNIGLFDLHLQCAWRFTHNNSIIVGDCDLYDQSDEHAEYDEHFNWDIQMGNLRDIKMSSLILDNELIVSSINTDVFGGFEIIFYDEIRLTVYPNFSGKSEYNEYWRLMDNINIEKKHFVVGTTGIDF